MRLSIVSYSARKIGGTEQNLDVVLPELERRGHQLQFVYFHDEPASRPAIRTSAATELVDVGQIGEARALDRLEAFHPDLINVHGEIDPAFQSKLLEIAPAAYSVHNYYGTCISGLKTHSFPVIQPCNKTFGPGCLVNYYPRRCGGLNPLTMFHRYARERARLEVMARYDAVITHSSHMGAEYKRHGLNSERLHGLPYEVTTEFSGVPVSASNAIDRSPLELSARLLFVGRMETLKGGQVLLASLPQVRNELQRPIEVHFAGDGPKRERWQKLADHIMAENSGISVRFHGWLSGADLKALFLQSHLLVVPSLWPEPFGKVGPEAGTYGLPVAAFAVGGIEEWLLSGVNGMTAPGNPPTAAGLAEAIAASLRDPVFYAALSEGAFACVKRFELKAHVDSLVALFEKVCGDRRGTALNAVAE
jgi:glycosyltransferase involved in cell wall biosynthesis